MSRVARIDRMRWLRMRGLRMRGLRMRGLVWSLLVAACSSPPPPPTTAPPFVPVAWTHATLRDGFIVDSHVHLAYYPVADQLAEHHVGGAVDLAAPESALGATYPFPVIQSGPMLTRPGGYPLDAWGSNGYGIGCEHLLAGDSCSQIIDRLHVHGAHIIKIALDDDGLDEFDAMVAIRHAHGLGMKVAVHALTDKSALFAGKYGADVLAHTPLEPLSKATIEAWRVTVPAKKSIDGMATYPASRRERAVITTLAAFGGSPVAIENLRKLRAVGVTVLYGTDLGNLRIEGPSTEEMELMKQAGMSDEDVQNAMTTLPWHFWGFDAIEPR